MILRVLESQWGPFVEALCARQDVETAGLVLAERLHGGEVLLARQLLEVPDHGYQTRLIDHVRIDPVAFNRLSREARDRGLSVLTIHTHPGTQRPWFSQADDAGDARLIPSLFAQMPGPHGSLVIAGETGVPAGRVWTAPGSPQSLAIRVVGDTLRVIPADCRGALDSPWFDRQRLALGEYGQQMLRDLRIGVVGLGGTGSVVFAQLAHLGVGRMILVDGDCVEASNVSRIIGATRQDAGRAWKVDVAARYAERLGFEAEIRVLHGHIGTQVHGHELESCDVLFSCVDAHTPRALLNRLSYRRAIPVIDLGSAFRVDGGGRVCAGAGRVVVIGPGKPCLACWGHLNPDRLRLEALSGEDRARLAQEGYIEGAEVAQPSVIAFNTSIAGLAVVEFLRMVTGFAGEEEPPLRLSIDFMTGAVRRNRLVSDEGCRICTAAPEPRDAGTPEAESGIIAPAKPARLAFG